VVDRENNGLLPGAEPWSSEGGPLGAVCLHNFTAHAGVMRGIGERLVADGHTVNVPLLSGHGRTVHDIVPYRWDNFRQDAQEAYEWVRERCDTVVLIGSGCGGMCALSLAGSGIDLAGVAVVSTPTGPLDPDLVASVERIVESGREITTEEELPGASDINDPKGHNVPPDGTPARTFLSLAKAASELDIAAITAPLIGFYTRSDRTLLNAWTHAERLEREAKGPVELVELKNSGHIATVDYEGQLIEDTIVDFVKRIAG